jgi:hypothetical protein
MKICNVTDKLTTTERRVNDQGFLVAPGTLCRTGVQSYMRSELGLDGNPSELVRLMRTPEEVFADDAVTSFEDAPITDGHPPNGVTAQNWRQVAVGEVRGCKRVGDLMGGTLIVKDAAAVTKIVGGKSALSNGYTFDLDLTPGEGFDGYQRSIRGNHVAIVDAARGGPACRIADEDPQPAGQGTKTMKTLVIDGIPLPFEDAQAAAVEKLQGLLAKTSTEKVATDMALTVLAVDGKRATPDEVMAKVVADSKSIAEKDKTILAKDTEIASLKDQLQKANAIDVDALVAERTQVIADAKTLAPALAPKGSSHEIRKATLAVAAADATSKLVIEKMVGDGGVDKASEAQVKGAFEVLLALPRQAAMVAQDQAINRALGANGSVAIAGGGEVFGDDDSESVA